MFKISTSAEKIIKPSIFQLNTIINQIKKGQFSFYTKISFF